MKKRSGITGAIAREGGCGGSNGGQRAVTKGIGEEVHAAEPGMIAKDVPVSWRE